MLDLSFDKRCSRDPTREAGLFTEDEEMSMLSDLYCIVSGRSETIITLIISFPSEKGRDVWLSFSGHLI